jgi:hypothetical protein
LNLKKGKRMKQDKISPKSPLWLSAIVTSTLAISVFTAQDAFAQVPARFYWKPLSGVNAVPLIYESISGNTNPFDPSNHVEADANIDASLAIAGYAVALPILDRAAMLAVLWPMGNVSSDITVAGKTTSQYSSGFGDPMIEFDINLFGPSAQKNIPDAMRYEPGFSVDFLVDLAIPIGEYDNKQELNLGQNRWYGRVGFPIIYQIGDWVPGERTTLELLPAVWLFGDNDDFVGKTMKTDPKFQLDAHLTRDFTESLWGGVDYTWYKGGKATIDGVSGDALNTMGVGFTLGYQVNSNLGLTAGYKSTINDNGPTDMKMDIFMITLTYGWHPMIEGMKRLKEMN